MIRLSTILPVVVGLVAGVFAVFSGLRMIEKEKVKFQQVALERLVVAKAEIPYGAAISDDMLATIEVNVIWVNGSHSEQQELVGRVASTRIVPGMPVTDSALAPVDTPPGAENQIPAGYSLVPILVKSYRVQDLDPGNHVDVLHTPGKSRGRSVGKQKGRYVVQNVMVFSVGARRIGAERPVESDDSKTGRRTRPPVVTNRSGETSVKLLVSRDHVMELTSLTSSGSGEITLLLRRVGDVTVYDNPAEPIVEKPVEVVEKKASSDAPPEPTVTSVVIVSGGNEERKNFIDGQLVTGRGGAPTAAQADRSSADEESRPKPLAPLGE